MQEDWLYVSISVFIENKFVVGFDHGNAVAINAEYERIAIIPVAAVGHREESGAVQRKLHHARQVPNLGDNLRLAGAVLPVGLC